WWTTNYVEAGGFARTPLAGADPDVQFHFTPIYRSHRGRRFEFGHGYSVFTCVLRPQSRGSVRLAPDGTHRQVLIDHNFFADAQDREVLVAGVRQAREILASRVFDDIRGVEMAPGRAIQTDAQLLDYLRRTTTTVYHPVGTCRMGVDAMAVVDPEAMKVYGMQNLRVADASI
ncbi:MAG: choline dehydrogenase, partial [Thiothrix sp.]|nr:choline dehydrogenase [Thiothrix sp.]